MPVAILECGDDARERVDGVGRDAAEDSRVNVHGRPARVQLEVKQAAEGGRERRPRGLVKSTVPDEDSVGGEPPGVLVQEAGQRPAADLLLALEQEAHVDRQAARLDQVLDRFHRGHVVALVVGAAASV